MGEYEAQLTRARRNFALCVLQIQAPAPFGPFADAVRGEWRRKADDIGRAIASAETLHAMHGADFGVDLLVKANESR